MNVDAFTSERITTLNSKPFRLWNDDIETPFLFPVFLSGNSSVNMQSSYRHGSMLPISALPDETINVMKKTFENGSRAVFSVYETDEDIIIVPQFYASQSMSQVEQDAVRKCNYRYSLSQWTYEHILEDWRDE